MPGRHEQRRPDRDRLTAAAVTGLIVGAARAIFDWWLRQLNHG